MNVSLRLSTALTLGAALVGCGDPVTVPQDPLIAGGDLRQQYNEALDRASKPTFDDRLAALDLILPGFGGFWFNKDETLAVRVRDHTAPGTDELAAYAIRTFFETGGYAPERVDEIIQRVRLVSAEFGFAQLVEWKSALTNVLAMDGVYSLDADEVANRVRVRVADAAVARSVENFATEVGVPPEGLQVEMGAPALIARDKLQDKVRPVMAGLQIETAAGKCTMGPLGRHKTAGGSIGPGAYVIVNSHCTTQFGVTTGDEVGQPLRSSRIGEEVWDKPLFTSSTDSACPAGRQCRYTDAALVQLDSNITLRDYTLISVADPWFFEIWQYKAVNFEWYPLAGQEYRKTGRTTGTTYGVVATTCDHVNQFVRDQFGNLVDTGRTMLCQATAGAEGGAGDSGSPVFLHLQDQTFDDLRGIMWGSSASTIVFSPIFEVRAETTPAGWGGYMCFNVNCDNF